MELLDDIPEYPFSFQQVMPAIAGEQISAKEKKIGCREGNTTIIMDIDGDVKTDERVDMRGILHADPCDNQRQT